MKLIRRRQQLSSKIIRRTYAGSQRLSRSDTEGRSISGGELREEPSREGESSGEGIGAVGLEAGEATEQGEAEVAAEAEDHTPTEWFPIGTAESEVMMEEGENRRATDESAVSVR